MDEQELKVLESLAPNHPELQELWDKHTLLKKQIDKMESKKFYTPQEEQEMKTLKKEKLEIKTNLHDRIEELS